jgi:hypothetical protein
MAITLILFIDNPLPGILRGLDRVIRIELRPGATVAWSDLHQLMQVLRPTVAMEKVRTSAALLQQTADDRPFLSCMNVLAPSCASAMNLPTARSDRTLPRS